MPAIALDVTQRSLILDGREFGNAGAYEKVVGTLRFAVDPGPPLPAQITDLDRAPRNAEGRVEFQGDFYLLKPADPEVAVILVGTWGLLRDSVNLALDAVPEDIDLDCIAQYLTALPGVTGVHDLHTGA